MSSTWESQEVGKSVAHEHTLGAEATAGDPKRKKRLGQGWRRDAGARRRREAGREVLEVFPSENSGGDPSLAQLVDTRGQGRDLCKGGDLQGELGMLV